MLAEDGSGKGAALTAAIALKLDNQISAQMKKKIKN